jgi:drug/metabolite transporter (DMT)-like permease
MRNLDTTTAMAATSETAVHAAPIDRRDVLLRGIGVLLFSSVLFGAMAVFVRAASRDMSAPQIAFIRFLGSLLVLLALRRGRSLRPVGRIGPVLLRGLFGALAILLYFRGIEGAGAGLATLLHCTYPIWTALFAATVIRERIDLTLAIAIALCIGGIGVVLGPGAELSRAATLGSVSALAASVLAGAAVTTARQLRLVESAYLVTTYFMAVGTVFTAPALLVGLPAISPLLAATLLGIVLTSVAGQYLLHAGLGFAPAVQASLAVATSTVSAAVFEAIWLGERLTPQTLAGAALMVAAVALAARRQAAPALARRH